MGCCPGKQNCSPDHDPLLVGERQNVMVGFGTTPNVGDAMASSLSIHGQTSPDPQASNQYEQLRGTNEEGYFFVFE